MSSPAEWHLETRIHGFGTSCRQDMQEQDLLECSGSAPNSVPPARKSQKLVCDSVYDGAGECRWW